MVLRFCEYHARMQQYVQHSAWCPSHEAANEAGIRNSIVREATELFEKGYREVTLAWTEC